MSRRVIPVGFLMLVMAAGLRIHPASAGEPAASKQAAAERNAAAKRLRIRVQKVTFLGARHIKEDELRSLTGVRPGMSLNPNLNRAGCQRILEKYQEQGRSFASCELIKGGQWSDTEVIYLITEGPKVKVRDIQFVGNTFVNGARLRKQLCSGHEWFHLLGSTYNPRMAEADVAELIKYFKTFGYRDVKVSLETQRSTDGREITLIFHIKEGQRSRVSAASTSEEAEERPAVRIGNIILDGNEHISSASILAHLPLYPGQVLNNADLQQAEKTLAELGLFVVDPAAGIRPTITVLDSGRASGCKDILIAVKEKRTASNSR